MTTNPRVVWDVGALLGEGPAWFAREQALRFVDIKAGRLFRYVPATDERSILDVGGMPSFILPELGGNALYGSVDAIHRLGGDGLSHMVAKIDMPDHNRTNDGTVSSDGRVWFGTMDDAEHRETGAIYCLDSAGLRAVGGEAVVTNGPAVSQSADLLYHVDSGGRRIWRCTLEGGRVAERDLFLQITEEDGHPDGIVLDSEGCLWVALWDGWSVRRYDPDGRLMQKIDLPCARVTKIAFGGADLRTAYVTTARIGLDSAALAAQPLAGALFSFEASVAGCVMPEARLN